MKNFKFIVEVLNEDGTVKETANFKSIKEIGEKYDIAYHQIRSLLGYSKCQKKFYHPYTQELMKKIRVSEMKPQLKI